MPVLHGYRGAVMAAPADEQELGEHQVPAGDLATRLAEIAESAATEGVDQDEFYGLVAHLVAEYTAARIGAATKAALADRKRRGARLGRPVSPATASVAAEAVTLRRQGATLEDIADVLNASGRRTASGKPWSVSTVRNALRSAELDAEADAHRPTMER